MNTQFAVQGDNDLPRLPLVALVGALVPLDHPACAVVAGRDLALEPNGQLRLERLHEQGEVGSAESEVGRQDLIRRVIEPADHRIVRG